MHSPAMARTMILLAGGLGTRLRQVIPDRPKVLAMVAGRPFLAYVLAYLAEQGIERVILATGYLGDQVRDFAGDGGRWGLTIRYSQEETQLGTAGALRQAASHLGGPFFALNGDTLFLADLNRLWKAHCAQSTIASLALRKTASPTGRGIVRLGADGKVLAFAEKPETSSLEGGPITSAGLYVFSHQALQRFPQEGASSLERDVFPKLAQAGLLGGSLQEAYFVDIGTPQSLSRFEQDVRSGLIRGL